MCDKLLFFTMTYKRLRYLKLMLQSIRDTIVDYDNLEHLFIVQGDKKAFNFLENYIKINKRNKDHIIHNNDNVGLATGWNQAIEYGLNGGYKWIIKIDDDAILKTKGWLGAAIEVIRWNNIPKVISPSIKGLSINKDGAPKYAKVIMNGFNVGLTYHLGGICLVTTSDVYKLFGKFDENVPLHSHQDSIFSQTLVRKGIKFGYLEDYFINHGPDGTLAQEKEYPGYFEHRKNL